MSLDPVHIVRSQLQHAFDRRAWHGTTLLGAVRSVSAEAAAWRPGADRHNIQEIVVHAAFWKHRVHRAVTDAEPRTFELRGTNWFPRPAPDADGDAEAQWRADVQLLKTWHARLMAAVDELDAERLSKPSGGGHTAAEHLLGVAAHDVYHAGQIQLLKRLHAGR